MVGHTVNARKQEHSKSTVKVCTPAEKYKKGSVVLLKRCRNATYNAVQIFLQPPSGLYYSSACYTS